MKKYKFLLILLVAISFKPAYCWNSFGHKVIAEIAYENLSPDALDMVSEMNRGFKGVYAKNSFVNAAPWLDKLRYKSKLLSKLHYINLGFSYDNTRVPPVDKTNAVSAIKFASAVLASPNSSPYEKSFNFRVLIHVSGDLHQPLHAATLYSRRFPNGDRGANLILLAPNPIAKNLHSFWDNGGGAFKTKRRVSMKMVKQKAKELMKAWPCDNQSDNLNPTSWAQESQIIALKYAYPFQPNTKPSFEYTRQTQVISEQRIALAGCRLAKLLNQLATENSE